ncbi:glycosyltransferase [Verrucomicrobiota bacterium sgz303538]
MNELSQCHVPFILNVGSSLARKNRDGVLRILALVKDSWTGNLVFAGERLSQGTMELVDKLELRDRVIQIECPSDEILEALYNRAFALLFPSKFEGFGWPVIEAQACGCPVLCSDAGSLSEVAGHSAFVQPWEKEERFAAEILRIAGDQRARQRWIQLGYENAKRFTTERMINEYVEVYRHLVETNGVEKSQSRVVEKV